MADRLVLYGGKVCGPAGQAGSATALAAEFGRITYVGDDSGALELPRGKGTELLDLRGARVLPGLTDAHLHFRDLALGLRQVDAELATPGAVAEAVARRAAEAGPGAWVIGYGWNRNAWDGAFPSKGALDAAAPANPVCLQDKSGHAIWANSAALAAAGISAGRADPPDGKILKDAAGEPTGILLEGAMALMLSRLPAPSVEEIAAAMGDAIAKAQRFGLVGVHDLDGADSFAALQLLRSRGRLGLRVVKSVPLALLDQAIALGLRSGLGDGRLAVGPVKMFADGAMGPRTAWMLEGYEGAPEDRGICVTPPEALREAVAKANAAGLACAIHAIGDRANREMLGIFAAARESTAAALRAGAAAPAAPNRIEHAQVLHPADIARFAELGVVASMQPIHATSEIGYTDRNLGARSAGAYAFASLLRSGAELAFGSDCPVETMDPLAGIHAAVTRRNAAGEPGPEGWRPGERLSVAEAVRAYSLGAARAAGLGRERGGIEVGKLADLTILDRDIYAIPPMEILEAKVAATVVGGSFAYRAGWL
ncbi:MAG TPA: amidohydrolase [Spirochaetales bacterium]|nr:amidohydrolase [Spirochaetales bacterium]HRY53868.1 amidohydrolase [Spirochaetia bacterium]HRZ64720.1 amidohydrolase [Spirochaetia bacterium]